MPSFDIVSELDKHELTNAVDQANREVQNRYDFKGVAAKFELNDDKVQMEADVDFQLKQMLEVFRAKLISRGIDVKSIEEKPAELAGVKARQELVMKQGLDQAVSKKITKAIKDAKLKVQTQIQGEKVRVTGKKRDDLQEAIALLKDSDIEMPLQFNNFRD